MSTGINVFLASGDATTGNPQTDPSASLSGKISSTRIDELQSTLTSVPAALPRSVFIDTTEIGSSHAGKWILFRDGNNDNNAREIIAFNTSTGEYTVQPDLANDAVAADTYQIFDVGALFNPVTADQSVRVAPKHRLAFWDNTGGPIISPFRAYVVPIEPGPLVCDIAIGLQSVTVNPITGVADEEDTPNLATASNFVQGTSGAERFQRTPSFSLAEFESPITDTSFNSGSINSLFVKMSFRDGEPLPLAHRAVFQIFVDDGTGDTGSALIIIDVNGADEVLTLGPDRALRLKGGARVQAIVRDLTTGKPVPGKTVNLRLTSGPGTMTDLIGAVTDDSGNPVQTPYLSPTNEASVGDTVIFTSEVN